MKISKPKTQNPNIYYKLIIFSLSRYYSITKRFTLGARRYSSGYSLIELLIVITLVGIIGAITFQVFIIGLRARWKSEVIKEVKQNGDYITTVVEAMVRNANDISQAQCNDIPSSSLTLVNQDGYTTTFDCDPATQIFASNSATMFPTPTVSMRLSSANVEVSNCTFRIVCPTPPLSPKYMFLNFTLSQAGGSELPMEKLSTFDYQTTVSLRGYQ